MGLSPVQCCQPPLVRAPQPLGPIPVLNHLVMWKKCPYILLGFPLFQLVMVTSWPFAAGLQRGDWVVPMEGCGVGSSYSPFAFSSPG